ncbi:uncharacterized protein LOC107197795 [Astyanax mexicanus]|uniref:uncharacterized protein LOC107197795 n=1 Tax=Astyanax mexicanus TaxID=7994 RepID=UPI0020CB3C7B|nr:uncharacterized protein LOC107197795 [Astyanax mexicanus]
MGKKSDLSDFDRGMIVGARRAGCSVSKTADSLGFSRTTVSRVFREWNQKQKTTTNRRSCGRKPLVDEGGQKKMLKIVQANIRATTKQITDAFNDGTQRVISERTAYRTLCRMGFIKTKSTTASLQWPPPEHPGWSAEDAGWSEEESGSEDCALAAGAPQQQQDASQVFVDGN